MLDVFYNLTVEAFIGLISIFLLGLGLSVVWGILLVLKMLPRFFQWILFYPISIALSLGFYFIAAFTFFREWIFGDRVQREVFLPFFAIIAGPILFAIISGAIVVISSPRFERITLTLHSLAIALLSVLTLIYISRNGSEYGLSSLGWRQYLATTSSVAGAFVCFLMHPVFCAVKEQWFVSKAAS